MSDQSSQPQASQANSQAAPDPMVSLEDLITKAKTRRQQTTAPAAQPVEAGPSPEELALQEQQRQAELQAQQQAQEQARLAQKEDQSEVDRVAQLEAQQQRLAELQTTPEFQARQQQTEEDQQAAEKRSTAQRGHVIHQLEETKVTE